jgi:hypothetical protein
LETNVWEWLSFVHAAGLAENAVGWYWFLPMTVHFGWTTAATLVNLNGSFAMQESTSDRTIVAVGHASALTAAALGVGVTLAQSFACLWFDGCLGTGGLCRWHVEAFGREYFPAES